MSISNRSREGFSLVEVVMAIGVVAFAIVAILGVFPVALNTGHSAQDETRAAQIAQDILTSIVSQAQANFATVTVNQSGTTTAQNFSYGINLANANTYSFSADNDGHLVVPAGSMMQYPYQVIVAINPNPAGFDTGYASLVTVRILSPPTPLAGATPAPNQMVRDYSRIVTKY